MLRGETKEDHFLVGKRVDVLDDDGDVKHSGRVESVREFHDYEPRVNVRVTSSEAFGDESFLHNVSSKFVEVIGDEE